MILYFSATGNNKYVAQRIAAVTDDYVLPLKYPVRKKKYSLQIADGENFGVVMPTYWEGLPSIILDYLQEAEFQFQGDNHYCYFVATYGSAISCQRRKKNSAKSACISTACMRLGLSTIGVRCSI